MASSPSSSSPKVTMKLLIDTKNEKVLFAEASKAVIDFLFNLLCLPIGTVVKLLSKDGMVGSLGNLYQSVENLNQNYMEPNQSKDVLLNPRAQTSSTQISGLLTQNNDDHDDDIHRTKFYTCTCPPRGVCFGPVCTDSYEFTCDKTTRCSRCSQPMTSELRFVGRPVAKERASIKSGFVKDIITFMVMDDLVIQPMSTISSITLLNKFNVKEIGTLQEKVVDLGMDEAYIRRVAKVSFYFRFITRPRHCLDAISAFLKLGGAPFVRDRYQNSNFLHYFFYLLLIRDLRMASSSGSKKTKRGRRRNDDSESCPQVFDSSRFCSFEHQESYNSIFEARKIHSERIFDLEEGEYPEISNELERREWQNLLLLTGRFSTGIVREFYANARVQSSSAPTYQSYVRGRWVSYNADMISVVLDLPRVPVCYYRERANRYLDPTEVEETLCRPGGTWHRNTSGFPVRFDVTQLSPVARAWTSFMHYSLLFCSNKTDVIAKRAYLVHAILKHDPVDICSILADDIHQLAQNENWLGHPILIHKLCIHQGVQPLDLQGKNVGPIRKSDIDDFPNEPIEQPQPPMDIPDIGAGPNPMLSQLLENQTRMEALMISQHDALRAEMATDRNALERVQAQLDRLEQNWNV